MKALVCGPGRIHAVADDPFDVPEGWAWVPVPDGTTTNDTWDGVAVIAYAPPPPTWEGIRANRAALLAACDWTQLPDSPLTTDQRTAWAAYRQDLRDVTETYPDPAAVVWPQPPSA